MQYWITKPNGVGIEGKVLIIDDDVDFQFMIGTMLRSSGYIVKSLLEGKLHAALNLASECDLILLDIMMPDMDGYELYQTVRANMPGVPAVLMTAFNYDKDHIIKRSCLEGLQGVIFKKPVNPLMLKKLLLKQCRPEAAAQESGT